jgi:hypothetical protein
MIKTRLTLLLIKYPNITSFLVIVIFNLFLNPNIVYAECFNWVSYTDTNPYPFDTWNSVYTCDNDRELTRYETYRVLQENKTKYDKVLNELTTTYSPSINHVITNDDSSLDLDTLMKEMIEDQTKKLIALSESSNSYHDIINFLPHYVEDYYNLEGINYTMTYECQIIEMEIAKTRSIKLIELYSVLNANYLMHNNYITKPYDLYIILVEKGIELYKEKLENDLNNNE